MSSLVAVFLRYCKTVSSLRLRKLISEIDVNNYQRRRGEAKEMQIDKSEQTREYGAELNRNEKRASDV